MCRVNLHPSTWLTFRIVVLSLVVGLSTTSGAVAATEAAFYNFHICPGNINPQVEGALVPGPKHNVLYGLITQGVNCSGTASVFALTPPSSPGGAWTETDIHDFSHGDGSQPNQLIIDKNGVLYGTTSVGGGTGGTGFGTAFSLTPPTTTGGAWTETILHQFTNGADGGHPGPLLLGSKGELFGGTVQGGGNPPPRGGLAFELIPPASAGGAWTETVLADFGNGAGAAGGLVAGNDGMLFGIAGFSVFSLTPPVTAGGTWTEQTIFTDWVRNLLFANGTLYAIENDSTFNSPAFSLISLTPPSGGVGDWIRTDLYDDTSRIVDGFASFGLIADQTGVLYGVNEGGGSAGQGNVFSLTPPATAGEMWTQNILHTFDSTINSDGGFPNGGLAFCAPGVLCGLTQSYGTHRGGTAYTVKP